jgi:lactoylglutathione lyase
MEIKFHSTVLITPDFEKLVKFYTEVMKQEIAFSFGNCVGLKCGLTIWELKEDYPIVKKQGRLYGKNGNENIEICFESDEFQEAIEELQKHDLKYLHTEMEELWGQHTVRFYDPDNNLVELGETLNCFVLRFHKEGLTIDEISAKTSVPLEMIKQIIAQ